MLVINVGVEFAVCYISGVILPKRSKQTNAGELTSKRGTAKIALYGIGVSLSAADGSEFGVGNNSHY